MIPVEWLWLMLIGVMGIVGMARGLWKELGVTTVLLITLFVLKFGWDQIGARVVTAFPAEFPTEMVMALYYSVMILFVGFIAYEGFTLKFPMKERKGIMKGILGLPGGLINGYLIIGSLWDVSSQAGYYGLELPLGTTGTTILVSESLTSLHASIAQILPLSFMNEFVLLVLGMVMLVAILVK